METSIRRFSVILSGVIASQNGSLSLTRKHLGFKKLVLKVGGFLWITYLYIVLFRMYLNQFEPVIGFSFYEQPQVKDVRDYSEWQKQSK